jgi:hypothetical protein
MAPDAWIAGICACQPIGHAAMEATVDVMASGSTPGLGAPTQGEQNIGIWPMVTVPRTRAIAGVCLADRGEPARIGR